MRMIMPGLRERRTVDAMLTQFFRSHEETPFRRAIAAMSRFYDLPTPRVDWYEWLDWGKSIGRTYETGEIHLVHPECWKRGRKYNSERQWIQAVYHEMGHYVLWADAERKADGFAYRFVRGVSDGRSRPGRRHEAQAASRARRKRPTRLRRSRPRHRRRRSRSR
jgi:hypothetical protein